MNSLLILVFVCGLATGAGLFLIWYLRDDPKPKHRPEQKTESMIYFGRDVGETRYTRDGLDEDDHPHDIERQGSHPARPPSGLAYSGRSYEDRYAGIEDRRIID